MGEESGGEVAEVSRRDNEGGEGAFGELARGLEVVEGLGDEAGDVDGVRARQIETLGKFPVSEGGFDKALAVVEGPADFEGGDVATESGELFFLKCGDPALGVKDDDLGAGDIVEGAGDCAAGVAGSRDEDGEIAAIVFGEIAHEAGHETGSEVLEGKGGAVEEFENRKVAGEGVDGSGEVDGFVDERLKVGIRDGSLQEVLGDLKAEFAQGKVAPILPKGRGQGGDFLRHVESAVSGQGAQDGFLEGLHVLAIVGGVKLSGHGK